MKIIAACAIGIPIGVFCAAMFSAGLMIAGLWLWRVLWQAVL